ncbi:MAG: hypothetical protein JJT95_11465 [Pararhodobacter sp.]|nr:hypothetical protein [Pararhodobacter sp.]
MTQQELETIYEALAKAIDAIEDGQRELYLAKLALALVETLDDLPRAMAVIEECRTGLVEPGAAGSKK